MVGCPDLRRATCDRAPPGGSRERADPSPSPRPRLRFHDVGERAIGMAISSTSNTRRDGRITSKSNPLITSDRSASVPIPSLARVSARRSTTARASSASRGSSSGSVPANSSNPWSRHTCRGREQVPGVRGQGVLRTANTVRRMTGRNRWVNVSIARPLPDGAEHEQRHHRVRDDDTKQHAPPALRMDSAGAVGTATGGSDSGRDRVPSEETEKRRAASSVHRQSRSRPSQNGRGGRSGRSGMTAPEVVGCKRNPRRRIDLPIRR